MNITDFTSSTPYTGVFVRQQLGQTPSQVDQGTSSCPDILPCTSQPQNPSTFATQDSYNNHQPSNTVNLNNENWVYIRGLQANGYTGGTNFFFYYCESDLLLWPQNWALGKKVTVGTANPIGSYQNWAYAPNPTPGSSNQILLVNQPFLWTPDPPSAGNHYCTICWADNSTADNPIPPDLSFWGQMSSFDDLAAFVGSHPNMGWLNTNDVNVPPPGQTYQTLITTQTNSETVNITVNFYNITSGTFTINLVGGVQWTSGPFDVSKYSGGYQVPQQSFPPNTTATLQVIGTPGNQSQYQRISTNVVQVVSPSLMEALEPRLASPGVSLPIKKMRLKMADETLGDVQEVFVLGQQTWNLNFNA
jgi:hypothetical protein